jgi:hypothetical protein
MAVVKINYSRQRPAVKAHLRYITHRRGGEEKTITRTLFTEAGTLTKQEAYGLIDSAKPGTVFYKVILSPDPKREDTRRDLDLWQLTRQTARSLTAALNKKIRIIAVEHNDHTPNRHVHAIFLILGRLSRQEFRALATTARFSATREALLQRKTRDLMLQNPRVQTIRSSLKGRIRSAGTGGRVPRVQAGCRSCGYGELTGIPVFYTYCPTCHERLEESPRLTLGRGIEL